MIRTSLPAGVPVDLAFSADEARFREEVRAFCVAHDPRFDDPTKSRGLKGGYSSAFYRELGRRGWLGLQLPARYGGGDRPAIYETIFAEELGLSAAPAGNYAGTVLEFGHTVWRHGTDRQRDTYLPQVTAGTLRAGHLYTEPEAGSDLAAIRMTARRDGDGYRLDGVKMFASEVDRTDVSLLLARTDPNAPGEGGLTMFMVDNRAPGVSYTRLETFGGKGTNQAYLDRVPVSADDRIGAEGEGWSIFQAIRAEYWTKNQGYYCGTLCRLLDGLIRFVRVDRAGVRSADPLVRQRLARMATDLQAVRLLSYRLASATDPTEARSLVHTLKILTDTVILRLGDEAMRIVGRDALLRAGAGAGDAGLTLENRYRENALKHFSSLGHAFARTALAIECLGLPAEGA